MCEAHCLETFVNCRSMRLLTSFVYAIIIILGGGGGGEIWTETGLVGYLDCCLLPPRKTDVLGEEVTLDNDTWEMLTQNLNP